jgi:hypothetical protein
VPLGSSSVVSLVRSGKASGRILLDGLARDSGMSELAFLYPRNDTIHSRRRATEGEAVAMVRFRAAGT